MAEVLVALAGVLVVSAELLTVLEPPMQLGDLLKKLFQEPQAMIIQSLQKYLKHPFCVMDKLMEVTMLIQKLSAKHSTSVPMMEMVV